MKLDDAVAHLAAGCDHLQEMRPKMVETIAAKFKD